MIFYFTGTGNSLYAAKQLDPELISIPQAIHRDQLIFEADSIGIVCPVYGHEMPAMVKEFLKKAEFRTDYFYLVLTYGNIHGGAAELAEQELKSDGKRADYINTLKMVDNFLPGFDMKEQIAIDPEKRVPQKVDPARLRGGPGMAQAVPRQTGGESCRSLEKHIQGHRGMHRLRNLYQSMPGRVYLFRQSKGSPHGGKLSDVHGVCSSLPEKRDLPDDP